jgi:hypothetical protein
LEVLKPELGTKPRIYYKNLHLITKCFVSGTLVKIVDSIEECAADVEVFLEKDGREIGRTKTDIFGEFVIDNLEPNSGKYQLKSDKLLMEFDLGEESYYLGVITLNAA